MSERIGGLHSLLQKHYNFPGVRSLFSAKGHLNFCNFICGLFEIINLKTGLL